MREIRWQESIVRWDMAVLLVVRLLLWIQIIQQNLRSQTFCLNTLEHFAQFFKVLKSLSVRFQIHYRIYQYLRADVFNRNGILNTIFTKAQCVIYLILAQRENQEFFPIIDTFLDSRKSTMY